MQPMFFEGMRKETAFGGLAVDEAAVASPTTSTRRRRTLFTGGL